MNQKKKTQKEYTSEEEKREKKYQELFPKEKGEKRFKRDKRKINAADVARFNADIDEGLSKAQVEERTEQGLVNRAQKKFSKTYRSIFVGNICTFFNLLCLLAALALLSAHAPISQFTFVLIFLCNISVGIFQEIRAKKKIDKLSILSSPTAKVVRSSKKRKFPSPNWCWTTYFCSERGSRYRRLHYAGRDGGAERVTSDGRIGAREKGKRRNAVRRLVCRQRTLRRARG